MLHALVIFTFLVPRMEGQDLCCALYEPSASGGRFYTCSTMLPSGSFGVTAIGSILHPVLSPFVNQSSIYLKIHLLSHFRNHKTSAMGQLLQKWSLQNGKKLAIVLHGCALV